MTIYDAYIQNACIPDADACVHDAHIHDGCIYVACIYDVESFGHGRTDTQTNVFQDQKKTRDGNNVAPSETLHGGDWEKKRWLQRELFMIWEKKHRVFQDNDTENKIKRNKIKRQTTGHKNINNMDITSVGRPT